MDSVDGGFGAFPEDFCDGLVCDEHAFLDELVGGGMDDRDGFGGFAVFIEFDFYFRHFEVESTVFEAVFAEQGGHFPSFAD